ncbi:MAG: hypothetical protein AB7O24_18450 [Kofleriaceae bacterium]
MMGSRSRWAPLVGVLVAVSLVTGCFGYNRSAKRWAYAGNAVLIAGGGAAIATDLLMKPEPCMDSATMFCPYESPIRGMMVAGAVLAVAGLVGIVINATRPIVKTSR